MKFRIVLSVVIFALAFTAFASAQTAVDINFNTTYQTIRGFGTSTAWQPVLNSTQANNLFGVGAGQIGLTIMRSRIDPSSTTGGSNWLTELQNAQQAQSINSQVIIFATPWSPPAAWKSNGSVIDGTLNTYDYDNFANYLNAFIAYEKAGGVNLYAISVQNEPDFLPSYESCGYSGTQMDAFIAQEGSKINTRLMMPESDTFNTSESDPTLNDPNAVGYVSIVGGHTYGTTPFYYTNAKNKGKDVWMTEVTYTPAAGSSAQPTISDAISAAELYHQSMAVAQYNAYVYWWTPLLLNGNSPNYYAYALGQYSKFVRPGYVMTGANNNPASGIYVTSYSGNNNYVIVAINANSNIASLSFPMTGATVTSVTPYITSGSEQLAQQNAITVSNNSFTYTMPAQSIVTFVGTGSSSGGGGGTGTTITPYLQVNNGSWQQTNTASVAYGSTVNLGPQPVSGGSWSWSGPNGYSSTSRQISSIPLSSGTDTYTATYTNTSNLTSNETFTITVVGGSISTTNYYQIVNQASGSCIDDTAGGTSNGTNVQEYSCSSGNLNQEWLFTAVGGGYYEITTHNAAGVGWNVINLSTSPGAGVQLYTYYGGLNAQFEPVLQSSGNYEFIDHNSGLCLNFPSTSNGQQLQINTCNGSSSEMFKLNQL
jgi:glucuronoarabinoxylan endo-1,4-beta-xylanase